MGEESLRKAEFDTTYEKYKDVVLQTAVLCTHNQHTAEDIMQEVFLRYYIYMGHTKVTKVKAWLLITTKNMSYNYVRDHKRETLIDVDEQSADFFGSDNSAENIFFKKLWRWDVLSSTNTILDALYHKNQKWYDAVTLVYCMEKPNKEVAKCMGITEDALQGRLTRAKQWIKDNYSSEYNHINKA